MQTIAIDSGGPPNSPPKRTRIPTNYLRPQRACDFCRRRKTKCDGPTQPDHVCTICASAKQTCTYMFVFFLRFLCILLIMHSSERLQNQEDLRKRTKLPYTRPSYRILNRRQLYQQTRELCRGSREAYQRGMLHKHAFFYLTIIFTGSTVTRP